jgi:hypothetical protein
MPKIYNLIYAYQAFQIDNHQIILEAKKDHPLRIPLPKQLSGKTLKQYVIDGRRIKSINADYNKKKAKIQPLFGFIEIFLSISLFHNKISI